MFSGSFFSNEGIPEWMTAVVMIVLAAGYIYYKMTLKKSGKEENADIWSSNSTIYGMELNEKRRRELEQTKSEDIYADNCINNEEFAENSEEAGLTKQVK